MTILYNIDYLQLQINRITGEKMHKSASEVAGISFDDAKRDQIVLSLLNFREAIADADDSEMVEYLLEMAILELCYKRKNTPLR